MEVKASKTILFKLFVPIMGVLLVALFIVGFYSSSSLDGFIFRNAVKHAKEDINHLKTLRAYVADMSNFAQALYTQAEQLQRAISFFDTGASRSQTLQATRRRIPERTWV